MIIQQCRKLFRTGRGGYLSYQDTFVWRKITFLWSDSKTAWGAEAPFSTVHVIIKLLSRPLCKNHNCGNPLLLLHMN